MTKYYHFRVTGSITMDMYVTEGEVKQSGSEFSLSQDALRAFEQEIKDTLDQAHHIEQLNFDQASFDRCEEVE